MPRYIALALFLACAVAFARGDQQPPVKTVTTGVLVDVTVVDRNGQAVLDLNPDEFELSEDAVRQQLVSVTLVQNGVARLAKPAPAGQLAGYDPGAPGTPGADSVPSVTAILFDRLSPDARPLARKAALAYVQTLTPPHDYAGVFLADLSLRTFSPFTNQQQSLARAIDQLAGTAPANTARGAEQGSPRVQGLDPTQPTTAGAESAGGFVNALEREKRLNEMKAQDPSEWMMARMELRMREGYQHFLEELEGQSSLAGLRAVVSSMADLPGRKSILYFTESLPITSQVKPKFDALIGEANRANITVYPVDAVGLRVHSKEMELSRNVGVAGAQGVGDAQREKGAWTKELENQDQMLSSRPTAVLGRLAKDTGGFLLENTNDLSAGVARMEQERTTYYLLGYQPTNTKMDGTFRKVSVKVKRPKVTVRARPGYVAAVPLNFRPLILQREERGARDLLAAGGDPDPQLVRPRRQRADRHPADLLHAGAGGRGQLQWRFGDREPVAQELRGGRRIVHVSVQREVERKLRVRGFLNRLAEIRIQQRVADVQRPRVAGRSIVLVLLGTTDEHKAAHSDP